MVTRHNLIHGDSRSLSGIADASIHLVVTSPPYPMIEMWDNLFATLDPEIDCLINTRPLQAFEKMHSVLDQVWTETYRVLSVGGFLCVNIGDATRSIEGSFQLFPNHSRIIQFCVQLGFTYLPPIIWRKPTNAPNKFMGSGMLPAGAYVTYEHEYILVFRKGGKRDFHSAELKQRRNASAYFWEERNSWFSDLWQLNGTRQSTTQANRSRSAAFPLELPYRLIQMYSVYGDNILDPFAGTGTTSIAAMISGRNSTGIEIDDSFKPLSNLAEQHEVLVMGNQMVDERLRRHLDFVQDRIAKGNEIMYRSIRYGFPVMTAQERYAQFYRTARIGYDMDELQVEYEDIDLNLPVTGEIKASA